MVCLKLLLCDYITLLEIFVTNRWTHNVTDKSFFVTVKDKTVGENSLCVVSAHLQFSHMLIMSCHFCFYSCSYKLANYSAVICLALTTDLL